jgi:hypothetical protein
VVSGNLRCLVNELCGTKYPAIPQGTAGWQPFKSGDRLPVVTFRLPFDTL